MLHGDHMKKFILMIPIIIICSRHIDAEVADFKKIIKDYLSVNTIKASITQRIYLQNGTTEFYTGNYIAAAKGYIRIDYIRPEKQTIVINDKGLYWYYCDRNLVFLSEKNNPGMNSIPLFISSLPEEKLKNMEIVFLGIKFYSFFKQAEIYAIYQKKGSTKLILWIDPSSGLIIRKYVIDDSGREIIKETYAEHIRIKGISIPSRIEFKARTSDGIIQTVTGYSNIVINTPVNMELFRFRITPDMKVKVLRDKN